MKSVDFLYERGIKGGAEKSLVLSFFFPLKLAALERGPMG